MAVEAERQAIEAQKDLGCEVLILRGSIYIRYIQCMSSSFLLIVGTTRACYDKVMVMTTALRRWQIRRSSSYSRPSRRSSAAERRRPSSRRRCCSSLRRGFREY